jgi:hypothetical protein
MASPLIAASLPDDTKLVEFNDFSSGMNTQRAKHKLGIKESPMIRNAYVDDQPLSLVGRRGMSLSVSTPTLSKINFGFEQVFDDGSRKLYVSDSSRVFVTSDLTNFTVVKNTMTPTAKLNAVAGRGFVLFTNGVDAPFISSGLAGVALDGTNGFPNVPRGKYAAYYQERFFLYNTTANSSALHFQSLTSTDGFVLSSFEPRAWPIINQLNVGQGDGSNGSALDVFKGQLQAHKGSKSIFTLYGTDETNYFLRKTNSDSGAANQESVAQADGTSYYFAKDGVNGFDSQNSVRISDDIFPDMETVVSNLQNIQSNNWDTTSDFDLGGFFIGSTSPGTNFLNILATQSLNSLTNLQSDPDDASNYKFGYDANDTVFFGTATPFVPLTNQVIDITNNYSGFLTFAEVKLNPKVGVGGKTNITITCKNIANNTSVLGSHRVEDLGAGGRVRVFFPATFTFTTSDIINSSILFKIEATTNEVNTNGLLQRYFGISSMTATGNATVVMGNTTGYYKSNIATISVINSWDSFNSDNNTGGGNITYFIRAATSLVQIANEPFLNISPGQLIPYSSSRTFIQWATTMTAISTTIANQMYINNVVINHNEGGSTDTIPRSVEWKKRFLMLCSTEPTGTVSTIWVKSKITNSKPNAWTKFTFANDYFRSIFKFNDNLYLGSGSSGKIYRFDYGTNDNGSPIEFYYETPEVSMDKIWFKKNQLEYLIEADQVSNATLVIKTAVEDNDFSTNTVNVDLNGDGTLIKSIKSTYIPKIGRSFTYGLQNNELDKSMRIHTFGVFYQDTKTRD